MVDERGALGGYHRAGTPFSLKRRAPAESGPPGLNVRPGRSKRGPRAGAFEPRRLVLQPQPDCQPPPFATSSRIRPGTPPMHFLARWEPRHGLGHCAPGGFVVGAIRAIWREESATRRTNIGGPSLGDHLKAALYFEECAERERRPIERVRLLRAARQFRWLAIAEAGRFAEPQTAAPPSRPALPDSWTRNCSAPTDLGNGDVRWPSTKSQKFLEHAGERDHNRDDQCGRARIKQEAHSGP